MVYIQYGNHSLCLRDELLRKAHLFFSPPSPSLSSYTAPACFSFLKESLGLFHPQSADWFEKLHWQALSRWTMMRRRKPVESLHISEAYSCWSSACWEDVVTLTTCTEMCEEREGEADVHLLTCSICLLFLPEWVSRASSATVPHSNKQRQFSSSRSILWRAADYERENGTPTSATGQRTDHPCQRVFSSVSMARTWGELEVCVLKNSWPHVVVEGGLRVG